MIATSAGPHRHRRPLRTEGNRAIPHTLLALLYLPTEFRQQRRKDSGWCYIIFALIRYLEVCTLLTPQRMTSYQVPLITALAAQESPFERSGKNGTETTVQRSTA